MQHIERSLPFGMAIGLGQVALNDQPVAVLHHGMSHEAEHCARAGGFLVKPRFWIGRGGMGCIGTLLVLNRVLK